MPNERANKPNWRVAAAGAALVISDACAAAPMPAECQLQLKELHLNKRCATIEQHKAFVQLKQDMHSWRPRLYLGSRCPYRWGPIGSWPPALPQRVVLMALSASQPAICETSISVVSPLGGWTVRGFTWPWEATMVLHKREGQGTWRWMGKPVQRGQLLWDGGGLANASAASSATAATAHSQRHIGLGQQLFRHVGLQGRAAGTC